MSQTSRKKQILNLRRVLAERRDRLRRALADDLSELQQPRIHTSKVALDLESSWEEVFVFLAHEESHEFELVENALQRIGQGNYGICEDCECKIPMVRLKALPYATRCVKCQREIELQQSLSQTSASGQNVFASLDSDEDEPEPEVSISDY